MKSKFLGIITAASLAVSAFAPFTAVSAASDSYPYEITALSVQTESGEDLDTAPTGAGFLLNAAVTETEQRDAKDYMFVALYDTDGALLSLDYVAADFMTGVEFEIGFHIHAQSSAIGSAKAFVWSSLSSAEPLAATAELTFTQDSQEDATAAPGEATTAPEEATAAPEEATAAPEEATADTVVAVFDSYGSGYYNNESVYYISAYVDGSDELETLYVADGTSEVANMTRGMMFVYNVNDDGIIEDGDLYILAYDSIFSHLNITSGLSNQSTLKYIVVATKACTYGDDDADNYDMFVLSGVTSYDKDFSNSDDEVRFVFAPVVDVSTSSITLGRVQYDSSTGVYYSTEDDQIVYTTTGANAYVYNHSYSIDDRLNVCSVSSLPSVSFTSQSQISKDSSPSGGIWVGGLHSSFGLDKDGNYDDDFVNTILWNADAQIDNTNYVFAKVVNDNITDIVYFAVD